MSHPPSRVSADRFHRLTDAERVVGMPDRGRMAPAHFAGRWPEDESPRAALEELIAEVLPDGPCQILFSGGRDSSALLAVATAVARARGADDPIAVSLRHPDAEASLETEWQELVVGHLGLSSHRVLEFRGEQSWLSPGATESLARYGLLWPAALHIYRPVFDVLQPGSLLTGEGGDLIIERRRATAIVDAVSTRDTRTIASVLRRTAGQRARSARSGRDLAEAMNWLTPAGEKLVARHSTPVEPLRYASGVRHAITSRAAVFVHDNLSRMVRLAGFTPLNPFSHPRFIAALARAGGVRGLGDRTAMMRLLFADLLPDEILARRTKAAFNETRWMAAERDFALRWSGRGVDRAYIDVERLRESWLAERPTTLSELHLHAAWLADNGLPLVPDGT